MKIPPLVETHPLEKRGFARISRSRTGQRWLRFQQRGFTLVTTLLLMILLTVIAVGLLTLSSISLRTSNLGMDQARARENAKLALMIAIGELQKNVGPDQVATAQATILVAGPKGDANFPAPDGTDPSNEYLTGAYPVRNPHWLGVFPTYEPDASDPLVRNKPWIRRPIDFNESSEEYLYDARYSEHTLAAKSDVDRARHAEWLVSKPNTNIKLNPATMTPLALLGTKDDFATLTSNGSFRGPLLFPATTSANFNPPLTNPQDAPALATIESRAPIVAVRDKNGTLKGSYAYMAVDNSQRFKLSLSNAEHQTSSNGPSLNDGKTLAQLYSPQNIHLEGLRRNGQVDGRLSQLASGPDTKAGKNVTLATVPLQSTNASFAQQPSRNFTPYYQHSFTTEGYGLLVNPITGGLKRNLTSYLERPSLGSGGNEQIARITSSDELGAAASSIVPDGIYDTASMLSGAADDTSAAAREKITWYAPVMGLLRNYMQLRNSTSNPNNELRLKDPEVSSRPPAQAESALAAFSPIFGLRTVKNALPALTWKSGIGAPYVPGSGVKSNLAPGLGVHPVLLKASANFYPAYNSSTGTVTHLVIPRVILHNPYNAKIKSRKYVVNICYNNYGFLHTTFRFQTPTAFKDSHTYYSWKGFNDGASIRNFPGLRGDLTFVIDNQSGMNPGETLLFCPDVSQGVNVKSSKYAELQFSPAPAFPTLVYENKDISKNVLSESVDPADGTAFYVREDPYNPNFKEWTEGTDVTSTMTWYCNGTESKDQQYRLVQLYQPSASANLSSGLMHSELKKYSLLQMIHPVNCFEDKAFGNTYSGTLSKSQIPDLAGGGAGIESFDKRLLHYCHASGARLLKDQETAGGQAHTYPLFAQHDLRAPYVGSVWSLTQEGAARRGTAPRAGGRPSLFEQTYWGSPMGEWWALPYDSPNTDAYTDPLHVDNDAPFRDASGRTGINMLHAYSKTGPGNLGGAN